MCEEGSPHATPPGDSVVLVTSGAIARGMRLMDLPVAAGAPWPSCRPPRRWARGRCTASTTSCWPSRASPSAQVLLTFFDMSARTHYLNARQTLRKLLDWRVVPVINENDTTTTDEISFGDNDFLAAQVAILVGADRLLLLTDTDGVHTADRGATRTRPDPRGGNRESAASSGRRRARRSGPAG